MKKTDYPVPKYMAGGYLTTLLFRNTVLSQNTGMLSQSTVYTVPKYRVAVPKYIIKEIIYTIGQHKKGKIRKEKQKSTVVLLRACARVSARATLSLHSILFFLCILGESIEVFNL